MTVAGERKTYGEGCIGAHALDLIGDRWALLIVRELMLGPKRFGAIKARVPHAATNMLTRRLEGLERDGILTRTTLPPPANVPVYQLTPQGLALWPLLRELCRWGRQMPGHDPTLPISPSALMLSMKAMYAPGPPLAADFLIEDESFSAALTDAGMTLSRTAGRSAPLLFQGTAQGLAFTVYGPSPLQDSIAAGLLSFEGDPAQGQALIDRFTLYLA